MIHNNGRPAIERFHRPRRQVPPSEPLEREPQQNIEAERSGLGAILLDNSALPTIAAIITADDFFHHQHRTIFNRMVKMHEAQQPIDIVTLPEHLRRNGELEDAGEEVYINQLIVGRPKISNLEHHARIVREKAVLRRLAHAFDQHKRAAQDAVEDSDAIMDQAQASMDGLRRANQKSSLTTYTAPELAALSSEPIEYVVYPFAARGLVALLDGAAKSAGKTTLIISGVAAALKETLFLNQATKRVSILYITEENVRTFRLVLERAGLSKEVDLHIVPFTSFAGMQWAEIVRHIEQKCIDLKIGWLVVDTFFAIAGLGGELENQAGAVDQAIAPIRGIAGRLDIPVTLTRHERKSGGDVGVSGRGSSALTGAADVICLLKRLPGNQSENQRQLEVTGRLEQARLTIELLDGGKYIVAPEDGQQSSESEVAMLTATILANTKATKVELQAQTGIGRNRIEDVAAKDGWKYERGVGWARGIR